MLSKTCKNFYLICLFIDRVSGDMKKKQPLLPHKASQVSLVVRKPPANTRVIRDVGSVPGLGRSAGARNGNPLQCSCLENPMDRGAWWATVHGVPRVRQA